MLNISKELFASWNEAHLLYCHWKSNEHLLAGLEGKTDLDVLLSRTDKNQGEKLLRSLDFLKCKSQYGSRYFEVDDWIGFDKDTGALIHLHLHYALVTGHKGMKEYSLPWIDLALRTRVMNEKYGVYMMEPNLEMMTLYTRIGLKADVINLVRCRMGNFIFSKDVQREIDWLKERTEMKQVCQLVKTFYNEKANIVIDIMKKEKIVAKDYIKLCETAEEIFKKDSRVHCFKRLREIYYYLYIFGVKKLLRKKINYVTKKVPESGKGLSIVFIGQDGAGKTTVTKHILKWWGWKMDIRYVYMGSGENYSSIRKRILAKIPSKGILKGIKSFIGITSIKDCVRSAYKNTKVSEKYVAKGGIVIFDRFPQRDHLGICDGPKIRHLVDTHLGKKCLSKLFIPFAKAEEMYIEKIVEHCPDIVFKLILPPVESIRRKPKEKLEIVQKKHEIVKSMKFEGSDVYNIDATMPYDEELVLIKNIIWQHIRK